LSSLGLLKINGDVRNLQAVQFLMLILKINAIFAICQKVLSGYAIFVDVTISLIVIDVKTLIANLPVKT
jgi:hypothetical protein